LSLLNIYDKFENYHKNDKKKLMDWIYNHFLKLDTLFKAKDLVSKIKRNFSSLKNDIDKVLDKLDYNEDVKKLIVDDRILFSLFMGFVVNRGKKEQSKNLYKTLYSDDLVKLDKESFLNLDEKLPKNVIYNELTIIMGYSNLGIVSKITNDIVKYYK